MSVSSPIATLQHFGQPSRNFAYSCFSGVYQSYYTPSHTTEGIMVHCVLCRISEVYSTYTSGWRTSDCYTKNHPVMVTCSDFWTVRCFDCEKVDFLGRSEQPMADLRVCSNGKCGGENIYVLPPMSQRYLTATWCMNCRRSEVLRSNTVQPFGGTVHYSCSMCGPNTPLELSSINADPSSQTAAALTKTYECGCPQCEVVEIFVNHCPSDYHICTCGDTNRGVNHKKSQPNTVTAGGGSGTIGHINPTVTSQTKGESLMEKTTCPTCNTSIDAWLLPAHMKSCSAEPLHSQPQPQAATAEVSPFTVTTGEDGFLYPSLRTDLLIPTAHSRYIERIIRMLDHGPQNLLLTGPAGTGKTALAYQAAAILKCPMAKVNIQPLETANELYGRATVREGTVIYEHSEFSRAATHTDSPIVVLLDDIAHQTDRTVTNGLLPALDKTRRVTILGLGTIAVGPKVLFIGTANQGGEYTGASKLDGALYDRFSHRITVENLPTEAAARVLHEHHGISFEAATTIAAAAEGARTKGCYVSMRGMENAAEHMRFGASLEEAIEHVMLSGFARSQIESLLSARQIDSGELLIDSNSGLSEWTYWQGSPTTTSAAVEDES